MYLMLLSSQNFEDSLKALHTYMKFHESDGRLVRFSRGGRACFRINVLNCAPFEIEAHEGIEEVC